MPWARSSFSAFRRQFLRMPSSPTSTSGGHRPLMPLCFFALCANSGSQKLRVTRVCGTRSIPRQCFIQAWWSCGSTMVEGDPLSAFPSQKRVPALPPVSLTLCLLGATGGPYTSTPCNSTPTLTVPHPHHCRLAHPISHQTQLQPPHFPRAPFCGCGEVGSPGGSLVLDAPV